MSEIPKIFGQFELIEVIGTGGMARVYRARQLNIERHVAIKIMSSALSDQEEFQIRFKREADVFAKLEHPHILPIYDYGEQAGFVFLVLRLMEGGTLEKRMRGKQLALTDLDKLVSQVAEALAYAHENSIVHRDMKPNNILLDKFGNAYLMDFGIAKIVSEAQSSNMSTMLGTPAYMAPEQWRLEPVDHRIDIYSLGVMIYEMLTGKMPFNGVTPYHLMYAHLHEQPAMPSQIISSLTPDIDAVVLRALAKEPDVRYNSATELAQDLSAAIRKQTQDTRENLASLKGEAPAHDANASIKSDVLGSILLALDRPNKRVFAVPKVEDFKKITAADPSKPASRPKGIEVWSLDDILQELETAPPKTMVNTRDLGAVIRSSLQNQSYLGVHCHPVRLRSQYLELTGETHGLLVADVEPDSLAEKAGILMGDTLISLDGIPLRNQDDLIVLLSGERVGKSVEVRFIRAGLLQKVDVVLESHT